MCCVLPLALGTGHWVRTQAPLDLGPATEPEPDVAVVKGDRSEHTSHPKTALLVVETSQSSLGYDREQKAAIYARAEIQDYWIVNLVGHALEVCRSPIADPTHPFGYRYESVTSLTSRDTVSPLALPGTSIAVKSLLG